LSNSKNQSTKLGEYLIALDNSCTQFKKRKCKVGVNHNIDINEYYNMIENEINLDDVVYERQNIRKVWSNAKNPLKSEEINNYLKIGKIFWNYRNINLENELHSDFNEEIIKFMNNNKNISTSKRNIIENKLNEIKKFLDKGVNLNYHFDEIALKILYIARYDVNLALFFLYKNFNPYLEGKDLFK